MIDAHAHILPNIDDGAADDEMALKMAQVAISDGISSIICTPHDLNFAYQNPRQKVLSSVARLQRLLDDNNLNLKIYPGAELHIDPEVATKILQGEAITLADQNKHALIEFPKNFVPYGSEDILFSLLYNKISPIITHPERNPILASKPGLLSEWIKLGCHAQLTSMSITGEFGKPIQKICKNWCKQGLIHIIASDAHRPSGRSPRLAQAHQVISKWLDNESADLLTIINPKKIIDGQALLSLSPTNSASNDQNNRKNRFLSFLHSRQSS